MSTSPLLTPQTFLRDATPCGRASKRELRGLGSGRRFAYGTLSSPEFTLRDWQRCQCATIRCRALDCLCEKLRFNQSQCLGAPDTSVGPSHLAAQPQGVAAKRKDWGVKRGKGNHRCPFPLLPLSVGTDTPGRQRRQLSTPSEGVNLASSGAPLYRRKVYRQQTVKKRKLLFPVSSDIMIYRGYSPLFRGGSTRRIHQ